MPEEDFSDDSEVRHEPVVTAHDSSVSLRRAPVPRVVGCLLALAAVGVVMVLTFYFLSGWMNTLLVHSPDLRVKTVMKDVQVAVGHFKTEYQVFPVPSISADTDSQLRSEGTFITALLAQETGEPSLNRRNIKFLDQPLAKHGQRGLVKEGDELRLVDFWGEMFYIHLDTNGDNRILNPEASADAEWLQEHPQPPHINTSVVIYSSGPDRDPNTWEDNITSWR